LTNAILVFASMSGNTETMAMSIAEGVKELGVNLVIRECYEVEPDELINYDGILLGSYTWGEGEFPDEFVDLYDEMEHLDFSLKKGAVFGSGSTLYSCFGGAVDLLSKKLTDRGAEILNPPLKMEQTPNDNEIAICKEFGKQFAEKLIAL
jgi:flavodoxin I